MKNITPEKAIYFRNEFRKARRATERDPQDCMSIAHVLESFGSQVCKKKHKYGHTIGGCYDAIKEFVREYNPASKTLCPDYHLKFGRLYKVVRDGRNDMAHRGSRAKYLAPRFAELSIVIEDALMNHDEIERVQDYMVRDVTTAQLSQPLSAIRQDMLINSFSYMPYFNEAKRKWFVVSDEDIARYLRSNGKYRQDRVYDTLGCAIKKRMKTHTPLVCEPDMLIENVVRKLKRLKKYHLPVLISHPKDRQHLLGILTASDLM